MSRRTLIPLIALGVLVFLAISFELARYFNTETQERNAVFVLLKDQARGDAAAMIARLDGCASDPALPRDRDAQRRPAAAQRRGQDPRLRLEDGLRARRASSGPTRVAWTVIDNGLPVVQCVEVERTGTVLAGRAIRLRRLSPPIDRQGTC